MGNKKRKRLIYFNIRDRKLNPETKEYKGFLELLDDTPVIGIDLKPVNFDPFPKLSSKLDKLNKKINKR